MAVYRGQRRSPGAALRRARVTLGQRPWRWPFHKDAFFGSFGLFAALGWAMCIVPVHHAVLMGVRHRREHLFDERRHHALADAVAVAAQPYI